MVPSGFNLATQLAHIKVGVGARGRPGRSVHRRTHSQICANCLGSVPLMTASRDSHKKGQIKPFLQEGWAACKIDSINNQFIREFPRLLTYFPSRSHFLQLAGSVLLAPASHSSGKSPFPLPAPVPAPALGKSSLSSAPVPFPCSTKPQRKQSELAIWEDRVWLAGIHAAGNYKEAC